MRGIFSVNRKCSLLFALVVVLSALLACTSSPPPAPTITITSPTGNIVPQIGDVTVSVQVSNFTLVDKLGTANVKGEGHIPLLYGCRCPDRPD